MIITLGITGHRQLEDPELIYNSLSKLIDSLIEGISCDEEIRIVGLTQLAIGTDQLFAKKILELPNSSLHVHLPFEKAEFEQDFENDIELSQFQFLLEKASLVTVSKPEGKSIDLTDLENRNKAYLKSGEEIANKCDLLLTVWNGEKAKGVGGTGDVIDYSLKSNGVEESIEFSSDLTVAPVINISPSTGSLSLLGLGGKDNLNRDSFTRELELQLKQSDTSSNKTGENYRTKWTVVLLLVWLAALLFSSSVAMHAHGLSKVVFSAGEVLLILTALILVLRLTKHKLHKKYILQRFLTERLRVLEAFHEGHLSMTMRSVGVHNKWMLDSFQLSKLKGMQVLAGLFQRNEKSIEKYSLDELTKRAFSKIITSQLDYHKGRFQSLEKKNHRFEYIVWTLTGVFILSLLVAFVLAFIDYSYEVSFNLSFGMSVCKFLIIMIPTTVASMEGYRAIYEWGRFAKFSEAMKEYFQDKAQINKTEAVDIVAQFYEIDRNMFLENLDWELQFLDRISPNPV